MSERREIYHGVDITGMREVAAEIVRRGIVPPVRKQISHAEFARFVQEATEQRQRADAAEAQREDARRWAVRLEQQLAAVDRERRKVFLASSILSQDTSALRDGAVGMTKTFTCDNCGGVFPMGDEDAAQAELADTFSGVSSAHCAMVCDACYEEMLA